MKTLTLDDKAYSYLQSVIRYNRTSGSSYHAREVKKQVYLGDLKQEKEIREIEFNLYNEVVKGIT